MRAYRFTIVVSGVDPAAPGFEDRFFEAGCDDATVALQKGAVLLEFDREAKSFTHSLVSAMRDVRKAGACVERIEPDYLVNVSDIAERLGLSRAAVSLWTLGKRGADFPAPVARITTESPLWDWSEVARWMFRHRRLDRVHAVEARTVRAANHLLSSHQATAPELSGRAFLRARKHVHRQAEDA